MAQPEPNRRFQIERLSQSARYDIPASMAREIGRFIVIWAHLERYVLSVVRFQLGLSPAEGRIALRDGRITDTLDIIRDIGAIRQQDGDYVLLHSIRKRCDELARWRHLIAHCMWTKAGSEWVAQMSRGSWNDHPLQDKHPEAPKGSKAVLPESIPIDVSKLKSWIEQTDELIRDVRRLGNRSTALTKPSPRKRKSQSPERGPKSDPTQK